MSLTCITCLLRDVTSSLRLDYKPYKPPTITLIWASIFLGKHNGHSKQLTSYFFYAAKL
jgi:hypothetical protein